MYRSEGCDEPRMSRYAARLWYPANSRHEGILTHAYAGYARLLIDMAYPQVTVKAPEMSATL